MIERRQLDRLTASDVFLLLWDDYGWSGDMGALVILDGTRLLDPEDRVQVDEVRRHLESKLHLVPRFRQLLRRPRRGFGWPLWIDAPSFNLADHVRTYPVAGPGDEAALLQACQELAQRRLDPARPLWELWLLPGLPDKQIAAVLKLHHAIADGAAAAATFGALLDPSADPPAAEPRPWTPAPAPSSTELLYDNLLRRRQEVGRGWAGLTHPARTLRHARATLPAWREVLTEKPAPATGLNRPVTTARRLALIRGRLDTMKQVAHAHDAKLNDVVLAAVAGGLRDLIAGRGEDIVGLTQRAMVTISQHDPDGGQARGNKPGWMMVSLPLGEPDPVRRLEQIAAQTAARKNSPRPEAGSGIFRFIGAQRLWYRQFPHQRSVNLVVSNIPGPPVPLYLAGAPIRELFPVMPLMGNLTLVVGAISYAGQLNLTAVADGDQCRDLDLFVAGLRNAMRNLSRPVRSTVP